ncbi:MAG TPA: hypothetical protein VFL34_06945 [Candidatus Sulfotelmatobacter sp.]|nr:hypothetical protein [Candidatus Sulfotelmatobacter sp.]
MTSDFRFRFRPRAEDGAFAWRSPPILRSERVAVPQLVTLLYRNDVHT